MQRASRRASCRCRESAPSTFGRRVSQPVSRGCPTGDQDGLFGKALVHGVVVISWHVAEPCLGANPHPMPGRSHSFSLGTTSLWMRHLMTSSKSWLLWLRRPNDPRERPSPPRSLRRGGITRSSACGMKVNPPTSGTKFATVQTDQNGLAGTAARLLTYAHMVILIMG